MSNGEPFRNQTVGEGIRVKVVGVSLGSGIDRVETDRVTLQFDYSECPEFMLELPHRSVQVGDELELHLTRDLTSDLMSDEY